MCSAWTMATHRQHLVQHLQCLVEWRVRIKGLARIAVSLFLQRRIQFCLQPPGRQRKQ